MQMVFSHEFVLISRVSISSSFTIENEVITGFLDHFQTIKSFSVSVCGSKLSVSPHRNQFHRLMTIFSDYDLSLVCTSRCDDDYVQCVSVCSSSDCLLDCNRVAVACTEGEIISLGCLS